ncbi:hypothetical protein [Trabulsiella odontotermitis]|uniref:Uncharacterized protein n=1 Tax=Trabulsiella odontotermitis TaxID=379893 RepID=A0A0L0GJB2_9ENTR|nr:hypothetical protein [Trabulsiella odontotermitis]KNC88418.1 hypothetical protein GM31_10730 [Trabulsiella odontotermitis]KNC92057.1 hypothetical protein GM30_19705 [Trabulsiella odontotermitis]
MPLAKTDTLNPIAGVIVPNAAQRRDCQDVIAMLDFADLGRGPMTLHQSGVARLDLQGITAAGVVNIQVQIGNASVAAALIAPTVLAITDPANQRGGARGAISVLNQSLDSGTIWQLTGTLP